MHGSILLGKWIEKNGLKKGFVCEKLGISRPTLNRYLSGGFVPSVKWSIIEDVTGGYVPAESWK